MKINNMHFKEKVINSLKWTSVSSLFTTLLQIVQISILARYLSPEDFGLMAIVMVVIGFSRIFSDMGISNGIIHYQNTSHEQLSSLYWLNIASGILIFLIISILSPFIAAFYKEPELINLLILLATTFVILATSNQYRVLFQKELQFDFIVKIEIFSAIVAFVVAIVSAVEGLGVYALAYATLVNVVISSGLFFFFGIQKHVPSLIYKHNDIKQYISFGLFQMGNSTANYFNSQIDTILIGKLLGVEALGIYSIAKQLVMRPFQIINPIITKVAFPAMAKVQDNQTKLKNIYLRIVEFLGTINFPIYAMVILFAPEIVMIIFGNQWKSSVEIVQILAIAIAAITIGNPVGSLLLAKGQIKLEFYWNFIQLFIIPIIIYFSSFGGLVSVAWAVVSLKILVIIPSWYFLIYPFSGIKFIEYSSRIIKPFIISSISFLVSYYLMLLFTNQIMHVLVGIITFFIIYIVFTLLFNKQILFYIYDLLKRRA